LEGGDRPGAEAAWDELRDLAEHTQDLRLRVDAAFTEITRAFLEGWLEQARSLLEIHVALAREAGSAPLASLTIGPQILAYLGNTEEILALPAVANPANRTAWSLASWCLAHVGRYAQAGELRERFGGLGSAADETSNRALAQLLEAAVLASDGDFVRRVAPRLAGMARYPTVVFVSMSWPRILGSAAALLGEREKALAYYEQALESSAKIRNRPELALTHLQYAELLLGATGNAQRATGGEAGADPTADSLPPTPSERSEAMRHLDIAIAEFREMKMQPFLERALRHKELLKA
jgi:tetratricopeptide (TPR) repeat protein